jgi:hypothetical protein
MLGHRGTETRRSEAVRRAAGGLLRRPAERPFVPFVSFVVDPTCNITSMMREVL